MVQIKLTDNFWNQTLKLIKNEMIPFQWQVLNDNIEIEIQKERDDELIPSEKSNAIENLKIAAGLSEKEHYGWWFQDSDVYKWIEGVAHVLRHEPDPSLEELVDHVVDLIQLAQEDDGYLNTYYQIKAPHLKFKRLMESHEHYCAGHLIEAAVAYFEVTGKDKLLKVACKFADCLEENFGPEEGKIHGADGHQEIELALVKLYLCTNEAKYLQLSHYFLTVRGQDPNFYQKQLDDPAAKVNLKYLQAYQPPVEQTTAEGHAVRLVYMCTGMAEVAYYTGNEKLLEACRNIWNNMVQKRMYVTGGIGSTVHGEAFTGDYDLPNDTMYCETCAAIGLINFANSMLKNDPDSQYADVMERALYNNVMSGMALDGKHYFYVNPLESHPETNEANPGKSHVKSTRPPWFGCACCPPNLARTISQIENYIYTQSKQGIYTHLYINHTWEGSNMILQQEGNGGNITIKVKTKTQEPILIPLYFRIPSWTSGYRLSVNEEEVKFPEVQKGYIKLEKKWQGLVTIGLHFEMPVLQVTSHPLIRGNIGKVAIQRGPFIYCLEEEDNGPNLHLIYLTPNTKFEVKLNTELGEVPVLEGMGERLVISKAWNQQLYHYHADPVFERVKIVMVPYYAWANRELGEMRVWVNMK